MTRAHSSLAARFDRHVRRRRLLPANRHVLVALSGGLDSTVLLHLLRFGTPGVRVSAAHFDHRMRAGSGVDAAWVRGLCTAWAVPLEEGRAATPPRSEAAARELRYEFLAGAAERCAAGAVATAHHADDQAETVLFRLARGTGPSGLAGIPERRGRIVRPLLAFERAELMAYAAAAGVRWREDPTNIELRFARNRVRHRVLPELEAVRPGAARRIAAAAARAAEAESAWRHVVREATREVIIDRAETAFTLARDRLLDYHPHIRARVVRHLLRRLGASVDAAGTRVAMEFIRTAGSGRRVEFAGGVVMEREFGHLRLRRQRYEPELASVELRIPAAGTGRGSLVLGGRTYAVRWWTDPAEAADAADGSSFTATFDASALRFPLELRAWRAGDRIRLTYGSKKLKKLFREHRCGRSARDRAIVLSDAAGRVLWVPGIARSVIAAPHEGAAALGLMVADVVAR
jgi:tRNA(Ile)-lysidine synthase